MVETVEEFSLYDIGCVVLLILLAYAFIGVLAILGLIVGWLIR